MSRLKGNGGERGATCVAATTRAVTSRSTVQDALSNKWARRPPYGHGQLACLWMSSIACLRTSCVQDAPTLRDRSPDPGGACRPRPRLLRGQVWEAQPLLQRGACRSFRTTSVHAETTCSPAMAKKPAFIEKLRQDLGELSRGASPWLDWRPSARRRTPGARAPTQGRQQRGNASDSVEQHGVVPDPTQDVV